MPIVNLTDVTVRIANKEGDVFETIEPSGRSLQMKSKGEIHDVEGIPVEVTHITAIEGLPDQEEGMYYIVPQPVARALNRPDLLTPDTGPSALRDENGRVYATLRLFNVVLDSQ